MYRWNAEIYTNSGEWGHFHFRDLSDSELMVLAELATRSGTDVSIKFTAEKDNEDDVAHIAGNDEEVE